MTALIWPFVSAFLFATGLSLSGMTNPEKVIGFLDVSGTWDPSLAWVMLGALAVYGPAYHLSKAMRKPLAAGTFSTPPHGTRIDARLLLGAATFGIGWGLAGLCPGPALVSSATGALQTIAFCVAMLAGFWGTRVVDGRIGRRAARASTERR